MKAKQLMRLNATLFTVVFVLHGLRILNGWEANVSTWAVPMWLSWVVVVLVGYLGWNNCNLSK